MAKETEEQIEKKTDKLCNKIIKKQKEVDKLMEELYDLDEDANAEMVEWINEREGV
jgi:hypothetical protein